MAGPSDRPRVLIVGGGFAGLNAARALARAPVEVLLVDRKNHHLFQPLLYQVATAMLSPADIASPIRRTLRHQANATVILGEVSQVDATGRRIVLADGGEVVYDWLVVATGATHAYFGHEEWASAAPGLKTVHDAVEIRRRFLLAFEAAERATSDDERRRELTFVVVGAGPTGVEMAGAMSEVARRSIPADFRRVDTRTARVILIEAVDRVLPSFPARASEMAREALERLGVEIRLNTRVIGVSVRGVETDRGRIDAANVVWAAGVQASPLGAQLAAQLGAEVDKAGRVEVLGDLSLPGDRRVFVLGDLARAVDPESGREAPGVAPAAIQMGRYVARIIAAEASGRARWDAPQGRPRFCYRDKGMLATIGRGKAVAAIGRLRLGGFVAWILWAGVHIFFLIGYRNRIAVMLQWAWSYLTFQRGARLITGEGAVARPEEAAEESGARR